jgi:hypothetical protein
MLVTSNGEDEHLSLAFDAERADIQYNTRQLASNAMTRGFTIAWEPTKWRSKVNGDYGQITAGKSAVFSVCCSLFHENLHRLVYTMKQPSNSFVHFVT